jgi:ankyrin repeat protein
MKKFSFFVLMTIITQLYAANNDLISITRENVNDVDKHGLTPLLRAAMDGKKDTVEVLLLKKADPNVAAPSCLMTPLHYAAMFDSENSKDIVTLLLQNGADRSKKDYLNRTPSSVAFEEGNLDTMNLIDNW